MRSISALLELAGRQHGVAHRRQAWELGITRSAIDHALTRGDLRPIAGGVLWAAGAPCSDRQIAMACVLMAGRSAALSHSSGAALWGRSGFRLLPGHATRPRRGGRRQRATDGLHDSTYLPESHVTEVDGIPVLTPSRLLFQLAGASSVRRMERLTDSAWRDGLVSGRSLHDMCDELSEHGRDGMSVMRQVLETRPIDYRPPDSGLEARFQELLVEHGLPAMRRQVDLGGHEWLGRVDFVGVDVPLIVLVDGERWHSSLLDREDDARQQHALEENGFVVVRITDREVWHDVATAMAKVRNGWRQVARQRVVSSRRGLRKSA
jgi:very-short-patch-repair endonuclease